LRKTLFNDNKRIRAGQRLALAASYKLDFIIHDLVKACSVPSAHISILWDNVVKLLKYWIKLRIDMQAKPLIIISISLLISAMIYSSVAMFQAQAVPEPRPGEGEVCEHNNQANTTTCCKWGGKDNNEWKCETCGHDPKTGAKINCLEVVGTTVRDAGVEPGPKTPKNPDVGSNTGTVEPGPKTKNPDVGSNTGTVEPGPKTSKNNDANIPKGGVNKKDNNFPTSQ
jgi:hypothetical protein